MSKKYPRNRFEMGQIMAFGPGKGRVAHDRVIGLGTNARRIASGGNWVYIVSGPESKMEILGWSKRAVSSDSHAQE